MEDESDDLLRAALSLVLLNALKQPALYLREAAGVALLPGKKWDEKPLNPAWMCTEYRARIEELELEARQARLPSRVACLNKELRSLANELCPARSAAPLRVLYARGESFSHLVGLAMRRLRDGGADAVEAFMLTPAHLQELNKALIAKPSWEREVDIPHPSGQYGSLGFRGVSAASGGGVGYDVHIEFWGRRNFLGTWPDSSTAARVFDAVARVFKAYRADIQDEDLNYPWDPRPSPFD